MRAVAKAISPAVYPTVYRACHDVVSPAVILMLDTAETLSTVRYLLDLDGNQVLDIQGNPIEVM